jgi:hypothetical protein
MSSERRIAANRANGAKSRGPRIPQGKARASRNAIRHGLLAGAIVLDGESVEMFREILTGLEDELRPDSPIERRFVETMAISEWRRLRRLSLERSISRWKWSASRKLSSKP